MKKSTDGVFNFKDIFTADNIHAVDAKFEAQKIAADVGFSERITMCNGNILDETSTLPNAPDAIWMSQFLDCFSLKQITKILKKVYQAATPKTDVYVLEPLWDKQRFLASTYSLIATSLYFTCMANENSKMYRYEEIVKAIEDVGFTLRTTHHNLGSNSYSLLVFRKNT